MEKKNSTVQGVFNIYLKDVYPCVFEDARKFVEKIYFFLNNVGPINQINDL